MNYEGTRVFSKMYKKQRGRVTVMLCAGATSKCNSLTLAKNLSSSACCYANICPRHSLSYNVNCDLLPK